MKRILTVLAVAALLAAMLIGAPVALAQEPPEECVTVRFSPGQSETTEEASVSLKNAAKFAAKHNGLIPREPAYECPAEPV